MTFKQLGEIAAERVADGTVPGLVVLVSRDDQVHVEAHGTLDAGGGRPVLRDSLFRITSNTKPVTGAATLALVDEGLFRLDEPVDRLLPELADRRVLRRPDGPLDDTVPAGRAVTVRDLLTFTFGFGMALEMFLAPSPWPVVKAAGDLRLSTIGPPDPEATPDPDTWIANLGSLPLLAQPGERWLYNTGAQVLGVLCERAAGQPFADVLRTRIFEPLGMRDTAFWASDPSRLATAYRPTPEGLVVIDEPGGKWSKPPSFCDGAAGLVSTADDLLAFARMLRRGGEPVLPPGLARAMTTDQLTPEQKARGGLGPDFFADKSWGFCQAVQANGAYGWAGGFGTTWLVDPGEDLVVIVLTQRMFEDPGTPGLHTEIQDAAYAALDSFRNRRGLCSVYSDVSNWGDAGPHGTRPLSWDDMPRRRVPRRSVLGAFGAVLITGVAAGVAVETGWGSVRDAATEGRKLAVNRAPAVRPRPSHPAATARPERHQHRATSGSKPEEPVYYIDDGPKTVALTIDDGPSPVYTPQILQVLADYHVTASFSMVGRNVAMYPEIAREVADAGHTIANHTWSHPDMPLLSRAVMRDEITRATDVIHEVTGRRPTMFRAPYGAWSTGLLDYLASESLTALDWSVDPRDWARPGVGAIVHNILSTTRTGSIILEHDGGGDRAQTVAALRTVLPRLLDDGYRFALP